MSFELLSEPIRRYVRDKRWEALRPIQAAAIAKILSTDDNYILASRTASGKTEAAFLPILSKVDFGESGVQVLYIAPLVALINDQFSRVEELCKYLDVEVTKWHGEASRSLKEKLIKDPKGIVLITPESIEAMFVNAPYNVKGLFTNLKFVVIDEIHSFIGTDRGVQLKSLLSRLQQVNSAKFTVVGLSATIGDYQEAKRMTGDEGRTKVLLDRTSKEMETRFRFFESETTELPLDLLKDLYKNTYQNKVLIFPNSRGRAEEIAVKLKKISDKLQGHSHYFSHHSSVDKELREYVEHFAKTNTRKNFCISCTSTLELGIDIGSVDKVVQVDATHSIASLIQRVGRSGRREGEKSVLLLYATDNWSLVQSLACWLLYQEGFIEPIATSEKSYDILLHQILSIIKEASGTKPDVLLESLQHNVAFGGIAQEEKVEVIEHLIKLDLLELIGGELIIGVEGEKVVNSREFYSVFKTEPSFKVVNAGNAIGEIPFSLQVKIGENLLLAARMWKIVDVDERASKIEVVPANDGKKPLFFGSGGVIHDKIRERMLQLLFESAAYPELDEASMDKLQEMRKEFSAFPIESIDDDRPIIYKESETIFFSFASTKVNRTLGFLLNKMNVEAISDEGSSMFEIKTTKENLILVIQNMKEVLNDIDFHLENALIANASILSFSKWGQYLPLHFQIRLVKDRYFDFKETEIFLNQLRLVEMDVQL